jgi:group I intron endonuclease
MNNITGIYKITSPSEKVYIGQSEDINDRWNDYRKLRNCENQRRLYNSFMYYGVENHTFEIIKECESHELNYYERHYQEYYDVIGEYGLNCILTNIGDKKKIVCEETKEKIRKKLTGVKLSEEHKANISKGQIGSKRTIDTKIKMSEKTKEAYKNGKICNKGKNNGRCKQVIDLTTGFFYDYAGEAFKSQNQIKNLSYFMSMLNGNSHNKTNFIYI